MGILDDVIVRHVGGGTRRAARAAASTVAVAALAALVAGCATATEAAAASNAAPSASASTEAGSSTSSASSGAAISQVRQVAAMPLPAGGAAQLTFDTARGALWYVVVANPGPPRLYEANATTGAVAATFELPQASDETAIGGAGTKIAVAPDGSVWLTYPYALVRVDPTTGAARTVSLSQTVADQLANPGDPGTWTTAVAFTTSSALVGRNNVPYLQQFSLAMQPEANVPLPANSVSPVGLAADDGHIIAAFNTPTAVQRVAVALPATLATQRSTPASISVLTGGGTDGAFNERFVAADGRTLLTTDTSTDTMTWQPAGGSALTIPWPARHGEVTNPVGHQIPAVSHPQVTAAVDTTDGILWLVENDFNTWQLQGFTAAD